MGYLPNVTHTYKRMHIMRFKEIFFFYLCTSLVQLRTTKLKLGSNIKMLVRRRKMYFNETITDNCFLTMIPQTYSKQWLMNCFQGPFQALVWKTKHHKYVLSVIVKVVALIYSYCEYLVLFKYFYCH